MAAIANKKLIGATNSNGSQIQRARYDFSVDGGVTGSLDIFEAEGAVLVKNFYAVVKTACASTGSMTLDVGVADAGGTTDADYFNAAVAVAALSGNVVLRPLMSTGTPDLFRLPLYLSASGKLTMAIAAAPLSGGVIEFVTEFTKA